MPHEHQDVKIVNVKKITEKQQKPDDSPTMTKHSPQDASSSFYEGDNRQSGGAAISAFTDPIEDRNLCAGPLFIGPNGEYAGGVLTQTSTHILKGEWVQIRLASPAVHRSVGLAFRPTQGAANFAILGSNDGSTFTELLRAKADVAWPLGNLVLFPFDNNAPYQYYRLLILQGQKGCGGYVCVHRIEYF